MKPFVSSCVVKGGSGKREVKAASLPSDPRTFDPDAPSHRFHQLLTDVKAQACSSDGTSQVPFQPDKFPKEQRNIVNLLARPYWLPHISSRSAARPRRKQRATGSGLARSSEEGGPMLSLFS